MPLTLDQATALEHVGDTLYIGFNDDLERVSFPKLKSIGGALIIEHNGALKEVLLPALERVTKYVHLHDNAGLVVVELPKLKTLGGELSLVGNPNLHTVKVAVASSPARMSRLEVKDCGKPVYPSLHGKAG
ncbi:MAG TPA: hypothetical protein VGF99_03005 [Myxococcota bacterium]